MATPLKAPKDILKFAWSYVKSRGLYSIVGAYFVLSAMLYAFVAIDVCIPCIWNTLFDIHCPTCGITTAFIHLLKLDPVGAWEANPMIYIVIPAVGFFVWKDLVKHNEALESQVSLA